MVIIFVSQLTETLYDAFNSISIINFNVFCIYFAVTSIVFSLSVIFVIYSSISDLLTYISNHSKIYEIAKYLHIIQLLFVSFI